MMVVFKAATLGVVFATTIIGSLAALESDAFVYTTRQTGFVSFAPSEFVPVDATSAANYRSGSQAFTSATEGVQVCGAAPLRLPQGAVLQSTKAQYSSAGSSDEPSRSKIDVYRRATFSNDGFSNLSQYEYLSGDAPKNTLGSIGFSFKESNPTLSKINNDKYIYTIRVCTEAAAFVYSVQVKYFYRNAGE